MKTQINKFFALVQMNKFLKKTMSFALLVPLAMASSAIGQIDQAETEQLLYDTQPVSFVSVTDDLAVKGTQLVEKYCLHCHGGEASKGDEDFNIVDHKCLTEHDNGYVAKGDLDDSYLWQRIADGEMPPKKSDQPTEEEIETLKAWVMAGAPIEYVKVQDPQQPTKATNDLPGGFPPSTTAVPQANIPAAAAQVKLAPTDLAIEGVRILDQYCGKCHPGKGNPEFDPSDRDLMIRSAEKMLVPGAPKESLLWQRIVDGEMPPPRAIEKNTAVAMPAADQAILKQWIEAGAPYPEDKSRGEFIATADIWQWASDDLRSMPQVDRPYVRYFSLDNIHNNYERYSDDEYVAHHAALSKVCNSLSQESRITPTHKIDPSGSLWRIDLRDYGWDGLAFDGCGQPRFSAWKLLLAKYPYGLSYDNHDDLEFRNHYDDVLRMTGSQMPIIRGDWFIYNSTQDELYYLINRIPNTDARLERHLGVDVRKDFMDKRLLRSAIVNSGISVSNRLMDRHRGRDGYYWKSYDFAINANKNNLAQFPLGPEFEGHPHPNSAFDQDGGEMIYSLPNGMQAYMLIDGEGNRIERGPPTVVGDGMWTSGTPEVANAISCMNCHANGMRFYADNMKQNLAVFGNQKRFTEALFDPRNELKSVLDDDSRRFRRACYQCYEGVVDKVPESYFKPGTEPVAVAAHSFWKELSPTDVGYEIGMLPPGGDPAQLGFQVLNQVKGNIGLQTQGMMPLTNPNGKIRRETWDNVDGFGAHSLFQEACTGFNLASGRDCSTSDAVKIFEAFGKGTEHRYQP